MESPGQFSAEINRAQPTSRPPRHLWEPRRHGPKAHPSRWPIPPPCRRRRVTPKSDRWRVDDARRVLATVRGAADPPDTELMATGAWVHSMRRSWRLMETVLAAGCAHDRSLPGSRRPGRGDMAPHLRHARLAWLRISRSLGRGGRFNASRPVEGVPFWSRRGESLDSHGPPDSRDKCLFPFWLSRSRFSPCGTYQPPEG
jgi:hypothetical protein